MIVPCAQSLMKIYVPSNLNPLAGFDRIYGWIDDDGVGGDIFICSFFEPNWIPELKVRIPYLSPYIYIYISLRCSL